MFDKITSFTVTPDDFEILDSDLVKTAGLILPDGIQYDPDFLYMRLKSISAGEYWGSNKNADYFPEIELVQNYKTFMDAHAFKNHENKDIKNAIGDVLSAEWDDKMKSVYLIIRLDRTLAPTVVRGFEKGIMTDVSMGCRIKHSICSICGNIAKVKSQYCLHIRTMRNQILPDGRKVYEINIQPKFHDISAVLNGAEKSAKVINLLISGSKVAWSGNNKKMEKVAKTTMENEMEKVAMAHTPEMNKLAFDNLEIFPERKIKSKREYMDKVAEIKKEIEAKIMSVVDSEIDQERIDAAENLKATLFLTASKFWDEARCEDIANRIKGVAAKNRICIPEAFDKFLSVLDFAGIVLTPLEFSQISSKLMGIDSDPNAFSYRGDPEDVFSDMENVILKNEMPEDFASSFSGAKYVVAPQMDNFMPLMKDNPVKRMRIIIIKASPKLNVSQDDTGYGDMMDIIKNDIEDRSLFDDFLVKRIMNGNINPVTDYNQFSPINYLKLNSIQNQNDVSNIVNMLLYTALQGSRLNKLSMGLTQYGMVKYAGLHDSYDFDNILDEYIEKKAFKGYGLGNALLIGAPLTLGYSALQRAREARGENLNAVNKFVADNPGQAAALQTFFGPMAFRRGKGLLLGGKNKIVGGVKAVGNKMKNIENASVNKRLGENAVKSPIRESLENQKIKEKGFFGRRKLRKQFNKNAMESGEFSIFKNAKVDEALKQSYSDKQIEVLKYATVVNELGMESVANEILHNFNLNICDIDNYLQISKNSIKMDIEDRISKCAEDNNFLKGIATDTGMFTMFTSPRKSLLPLLPGAAVDAAVFRAISNKLSQNASKAKQVDQSLNKATSIK